MSNYAHRNPCHAEWTQPVPGRLESRLRALFSCRRNHVAITSTGGRLGVLSPESSLPQGGEAVAYEDRKASSFSQVAKTIPDEVKNAKMRVEVSCQTGLYIVV